MERAPSRRVRRREPTTPRGTVRRPVPTPARGAALDEDIRLYFLDSGPWYGPYARFNDPKEADVSKAVLVLTETTFEEEVTTSSMPVVVEFWAEWCPPCKAIAPILDELAKEYEARLGVFKINADEEPGLATRYEVTSVPTMLVFSDGMVQRRMIGARSRARLIEEIREFIG